VKPEWAKQFGKVFYAGVLGRFHVSGTTSHLVPVLEEVVAAPVRAKRNSDEP